VHAQFVFQSFLIFLNLQDTEVSAVKYISYEEYKRLLAKEDSDYVPYDVNGQYGQLFDIIEKRYAVI